MLSCKDVTQLISESMDRDLPVRKRMAMRFHLLMCKFCSRYEKQLLFIRNTVRQYTHKIEDDSSLPTHYLSAEARERIKRVLNQNL
jgi:hypothetical protein